MTSGHRAPARGRCVCAITIHVTTALDQRAEHPQQQLRCVCSGASAATAAHVSPPRRPIIHQTGVIEARLSSPARKTRRPCPAQDRPGGTTATYPASRSIDVPEPTEQDDGADQRVAGAGRRAGARSRCPAAPSIDVCEREAANVLGHGTPVSKREAGRGTARLPCDAPAPTSTARQYTRVCEKVHQATRRRDRPIKSSIFNGFSSAHP